MREHRDESGQAVGLVVVLMVVALAMTLLVARVGRAAVAGARAQTAADAAALAAARHGREAADQLAARNGGTIVEYTVEGRDVEVVVEVAGSRARARATLVEVHEPMGAPDAAWVTPTLPIRAP